ncbi:RagB/SusD family nutrient uptake outer membrane protein [uncultured Bacteroides sp.]|uniref:RagB/SusD family nutrient uptake outer membrane protein n=1 Tax=uncultured Bacteroides sp. TaxID=162156 RepID=UPI0026040C14|nr:RagB/SusD family nutrient uptake outer membrane protein [uncultured Bacteroides sp.]
MKKIYALFAVALCFAGCSLDIEPETTLADTNFWKSETDLRGACNRLYIDLPGFSHDKRSDELVGPNQNGISSGNRSVPGTSNDWTYPYDRIGVCNNIIVKGETAPISQNIKNRWTAEARFFRAYHYFDLVSKYGNVPLILKVFDSTSDPDIKRARDPREEIIQQCYEDLAFALEHLPKIDKLTGSDWGRVSKSAALGLLVRIGLYEGTHKKYHQTPGGDYKAHLKKAIDAAETMIYTEKKHSLYPNFTDLFLFAGEGESNKESVFVKIYGPNDAGIIIHGNSRGLENTAAVTRSMVDNFLYSDGLPREKSPLVVRPEVKYSDVLDNRDPRLAMTLYSVGEQAYKGAYTPFKTDDQAHGYGYPIKKGFIMSEWSTNSKEVLDKIIIRYAEVLISYAEALYEYNGNISDEKLDETINTVRRRSGFTQALTNAFVQTNALNMLNEIRRERMVEFIDEGLHYDDIIRWKTAEKVLPNAVLGLLYNADETPVKEKELGGRLTDAEGNYKGEKLYDQGNIFVIEESHSRNFDPKRDYLYPVPTYEISTSGGQIEQNPNWGNAKN